MKENTGVLIKTGSVFAGWNSTADGTGTTYAAGVTFPMGSANVTLYAQWTANLTFTVTFNSNGGTGTMADQPIVSGMDAPLIANPITKAGCTFTGWNTEMDGSGIPYAAGATFTMGDANITLFAQWKTNPSYNITFNNNGGSGVMATQSIVYGLTAKLTANTFTKPYSTFAGWAKTPTGAVEYLDNTDYTLEINEDITLYAVWTVNNVAPTVSALSITPNPVNQGTSVSFSATTNFGTAYPTAFIGL